MDLFIFKGSVELSLWNIFSPEGHDISAQGEAL
jgi:hypothetical protein